MTIRIQTEPLPPNLPAGNKPSSPLRTPCIRVGSNSLALGDGMCEGVFSMGRGIRTGVTTCIDCDRSGSGGGELRGVLVWLRTGPAQLSPEDSRAVFDGHFENMEKMAAEGVLLLVGPLGEPRAEPDHRGIYVFDVDDVEQAAALAATDPAVAAGVFVLDAEPFATRAPLQALAGQAARKAEAEGMRSYVIAQAANGAAAERAKARLADRGRVFLAARVGGGDSTREFLILDAETVAEARTQLAPDQDRGEPDWMLSPWHGSKQVERLPELLPSP